MIDRFMQDSQTHLPRMIATELLNKPSPTDLSLHDNSSLLNDLSLVPPGASFAVLIRHAERPDFKIFLYRRNIQITHQGKVESQKLGKALTSWKINGVVSSPVLRCQQTCKEIMSGAGIEHLSITTRVNLGEPGTYIVNPLLVFTYFIRSSVPAVIQKYAELGEMNGFLPLRDESIRILNEIIADLSKKDARILYLSHDAVLVPLITFFTGEKFTPDRWIDYLDGLIIAVKDREIRLIRRGRVHVIDKHTLSETAEDGCFFTEE